MESPREAATARGSAPSSRRRPPGRSARPARAGTRRPGRSGGRGQEALLPPWLPPERETARLGGAGSGPGHVGSFAGDVALTASAPGWPASCSASAPAGHERASQQRRTFPQEQNRSPQRGSSESWGRWGWRTAAAGAAPDGPEGEELAALKLAEDLSDGVGLVRRTGVAATPIVEGWRKGQVKGPGNQLTVDSTGTGWCMMMSQWPSEILPRWSSGKAGGTAESGNSGAGLEISSAGFIFVLCHSTPSSQHTASQPAFGAGQTHSNFERGTSGQFCR